ncbi:MAG TPA: hypothetical protein VM287_13650 [Egibacteraceae bacterium]|nr:hypothetical protein [Egibacteraceae bacterium]
MDLVTKTQQDRLSALERVVGSPPVGDADLRGELAASGLLVTLLLTSVGTLMAAVLGALWLLS